ncbi:MAG: metallophosphoesterase [Spirochaetia bacterium]
MDVKFYIMLFLATLGFLTLMTSFFWWKRSPSLRRILIATWFVLFYYDSLERLLLWHGSDMSLLGAFFLQLALGLCVYIVLYMMLFVVIEFFLAIFWPKDKAGPKGRRHKTILSTSLLYFLAIFSTILSVSTAYSQPKIVQYKVNAGEAFAPFKIVILADLHLRKYASETILSHALEMTMHLKPDLILFLGDNVDAPLDVIESMPIIRKIEQLYAPLGVYAVTGNNEGYWNFLGEPAKKFYADMQVTLLEDEQIILRNGVKLIGRADKSASPYRAQLKKWPARGTEEHQDRLVIYMDHQPTDFSKHKEQATELLISGHTHGGQFFPLNYFFAWFYQTIGGVQEDGEFISVASRGLGFSRAPIRLGVRPEIVLLEVSPKN